MSWTDERVELLKQLWGEGKTAAEIANHLGQGVTRNAVIGKAHRLKLSSRASPVQQKTSANTNTKTVASQQNGSAAVSRSKTQTDTAQVQSSETAPARKSSKNSQPVPGAVRGVKMEALSERMCRWPIGDPQEENFHFCGGKTASGATYCRQHADVAYQSSARKTMKLDGPQGSEDMSQTSAKPEEATPEEKPAVNESGS